MGTASDSVVRGVPFVSGIAGPAVADSAVGVKSPETPAVDQVPPARGLVGDLSDVDLSGESCTTLRRLAEVWRRQAPVTGRAPSTRAAQFSHSAPVLRRRRAPLSALAGSAGSPSILVD